MLVRDLVVRTRALTKRSLLGKTEPDYGFVFSVDRDDESWTFGTCLSPSEPRNVDLDTAAKLQRRRVKFGLRDGGPQIELISR